MATVTSNNLAAAKVVPPSEWLAARKKLLTKEKEFSRLRDELSRQRRELPWQRVNKDYVFDGANGKESLADLFDGRSQLIVYHFMFGPGWEQGCPSCSFLADNFDGAAVHMAQRDTTLAVVSRATLPEIDKFKQRMGWRFHWVSSFANDFNRDYRVTFSKEELAPGSLKYNFGTQDSYSEESPGLSVFYKNQKGEIFHTYSTYARGLDILLTTYNFLDMTPKGRDEESMAPHAMAWVRHHDRYPDGKKPAGKTPALDPMLREFREEVAVTRRVLDRLPSDKLTWRPHPKSMSLGQLAIHIASVPGALAKITQPDEFDVSQGNFVPPQPKDVAEIRTAFEQSVREAEAYLGGMTEQAAQGNWRLTRHGKEIFTKPRGQVLRSIMLNHWYHHRGQLSVYLRQLDVPIPSIYGPSADENPFM